MIDTSVRSRHLSFSWAVDFPANLMELTFVPRSVKLKSREQSEFPAHSMGVLGILLLKSQQCPQEATGWEMLHTNPDL